MTSVQDDEAEMVFRRYLILGSESVQTQCIPTLPKKKEPQPEQSLKTIKSLEELRAHGKDHLALKHIKEVHASFWSYCDRPAILLSLAYLVTSKPGSQTPHELVEVEQLSEGEPPAKSLRVDRCFAARNLVLEMNLTSEEMKMFYGFYTKLNKKGGNCGRGIRRVVHAWYNQQDPFQFWRQNRGKDAHKNIIKKTHYKPKDVEHSAMALFLIRGSEGTKKLIETQPSAEKLVLFMEEISRLNKSINDPLAAAKIIEEHKIGIRALPFELLTSPEVLCATLPHSDLKDIFGHLRSLSKLGLLTSSENPSSIQLVTKLKDASALMDWKPHPGEIFLAYKNCLNRWSGPPRKDEKDNVAQTEETCPEVLGLIKQMVYTSLKFLPQLSTRRVLLCVDIRPITKTQSAWCAPNVSSSEIAALTALTLANSGCQYFRVVTWAGKGDTLKMVEIEVNPNDTIEQVQEKFDKKYQELSSIPIDLASPLKWSRDSDLKLDSMIVVTGSHTFHQQDKLEKELKEYRDKTNPKLRYLLLASACQKVQVAKKDLSMFDLGGFDQRTLPLMSYFVNEKL